jgi:23S rRNA (cytosine1962-C5)-methyltransferase/23S rRNA (guanine2445-N2)-methyltransferase / 23S rRNA (guanine2069-N7)-methyltransferase
MENNSKNNSIVANRMAKNYKKLRKWLDKESIQAFRLYDRDIPEIPYIVDIYSDYAIVFERGKKLEDDELNLRAKHIGAIYEAIKIVMGISEEKIIFKKREVQKGEEQYEKADDEDQRITVKERKCLFGVNLYDYLDTGLFLDHRPLRKIINETSKDKKVLNLFAYTGSFSVAAALGGGHVTTVDMSNTYLNWAKDNFRLNHIMIRDHVFQKQNTFDFLREDPHSYDSIICDPPSFSNSKSMDGSFSVGRDHDGLIQMCMNRLKDDGVLYFSNNLRSFRLDEAIREKFDVKDITMKSIPKDFRDLKIHTCFEIRKNS